MKNKILTISIAAYNAEKYIENCLDSLCDKNVIDKLDIIIVNDGSSDNTEKIAQKYVDKYPDSIRHIMKENGGWGSTVNKGMELATGKYFKLLDVDDWYHTENLKDLIDILEKNDVDIVLSAFSMYDDNLKRIYAEKKLPFNVGKIYNLDSAINKIPDIQMHALAISKSVIEQANIQILNNCFYTDVQFVAESCGSAKSMIYFDKPIYCYRVGLDGQSISTSGLLKHLGDNKRVAEALIAYMNSNEFTQEKKTFLLNRINYSLSLEFYTYIMLPKEKRLGCVSDLEHFIYEKGVEFVPMSVEVKIVRMLKYHGCKIIHYLFELMRKGGKLLNLDFVQHAK